MGFFHDWDERECQQQARQGLPNRKIGWIDHRAGRDQEQVSRHGQLRAEATNIRVRLLGPSLAERVTRRSRLYFVI